MNLKTNDLKIIETFSIANKKKLIKIDINKYKIFFSKIEYPLKNNYNSIIPLNIFQTWHSKDLPNKMMRSVNFLKNYNSEFTHYLFDDEDCRNFIKDNYDSTVLHAFDSLIPGAYKADLWRYCVLYKKGGIYIDIKYIPLNNFKLINLTESEHFVLDKDKYGIFNAFMVCLPGNEKLLLSINKIVENVKNKYYGNCPLEPTGPRLLGKFFSINEKKNLDMCHDYFLTSEHKFIFLKGYPIFKNYNDYLQEQTQFQKNPHYSNLWHTKNIYKF